MRNKITIGLMRAVKDAEMVTSKNGNFAKVTFANNEGFGDKATTQFIDCTANGKLAETVVKLVKKGNLYMVQGYEFATTYTDRSGKAVARLAMYLDGVAPAGSRAPESQQTANPQYPAPVEAPIVEETADDEEIPF